MRRISKQPSSRTTGKGRRNVGSRRRRTVTGDLNHFLHDLVSDPEVREAVKDQIVSGKDGAVQLFFEAVAHVVGRPRETVRVEVSPELVRLLSMEHQFRPRQAHGEGQQAGDGDSAALPQ
jgi:hypothetical protein